MDNKTFLKETEEKINKSIQDGERVYLFLVTLTKQEVEQFKRICESYKRVEKEMKIIDARLNTSTSNDILYMAKKDYELVSKLVKSFEKGYKNEN